MAGLGFTRLRSDAGIFVKTTQNGTKVVVVIYVDDAIFCGPDKAQVLLTKQQFMRLWECRDLGDCTEFLGMRISYVGTSIHIDQSTYLDTILERCGMTNAKVAHTPLPAGYNPEANDAAVNPSLRSRFQMVIGSLLYLMLGSRPDIAFAITKLAQHSANPSQDHLNKALYICRYLQGTRTYTLEYTGSAGMGLLAFVDSDWGSDPNTRHSQTGYALKFAGSAFSWASRSQRTIAHSSTDAEYMALSDCSRQVVWIRSLLTELGYTLTPIPICSDNQGAIFISSNPVTEKHSKHIDIRYHYIRDVVDQQLVQIFYVPTEENPADILTKNLARTKLELSRAMLGLRFPRSSS